MKNWVKFGFIYAFIFAFIADIGFPLMQGEDIRFTRLLVDFVIAAVFGLSLSYYNYRKTKELKQKAPFK